MGNDRELFEVLTHYLRIGIEKKIWRKAVVKKAGWLTSQTFLPEWKSFFPNHSLFTISFDAN